LLLKCSQIKLDKDKSLLIKIVILLIIYYCSDNNCAYKYCFFLLYWLWYL